MKAKKDKKDNVIFLLTTRLAVITVCAGLILGLVYSVTEEPIARQEELKATTARQEVLPEATEFIPMEVEGSGVEGYDIITDVFEGVADGQTVGYTMSIATKGFSPNLIMTVGMDADGVITGVNIGGHEETPGLGANAVKPEFLGQYVGAGGSLAVVKTPGGQTGEIVALTGATITSKAVTDAVNTARDYYSQYLAEGA